jgi:hypothetical protein
MLIRSVSMLRSAIKYQNEKRPILLLASGAVLSYMIDLFVRGSGYFTPSSMLMLTGIFILIRDEKSKKNTEKEDCIHQKN